ncbi:indole-3-glycerol phosphate synthase [Candidatus Kinetoplastibacterium desouzaii TCC079E]|uniref:Indole-3-glycerol phosphate synthase n=1 Tax=Candidatus Kinetoplastidibacterium desouzai TCC079E TaxID=1208919 RepID=M1M2S0_9PROT|nr:indole-3-glycerol phosphate synthase TrpC [Candidatus Kinetoplastibacterium desouzaii]AGF46600.1 indole-3-glycerol phosphate synthase [Candidatus Kinetoplastibacterium desouzaii TCC079E]
MNNILKTIIETKKEEIIESKKNYSENELLKNITNDDIRNFSQSIKKTIKEGIPAIIAEIKKASPSQGIISTNFNPTKIASIYESNGATCISVLTDNKFFQGSPVYLKEAKSACSIPILRKDFIIDNYQVVESRAMGADCILLIAGALNLKQLLELENTAIELGMDVLIESHNLKELEIALQLKTQLIGINNRDLTNFMVSLNTTISMLNHIPKDKIIVTESGINSSSDIKLMQQNNVNAFLIGETLMKSNNPGEKLKELLSKQ